MSKAIVIGGGILGLWTAEVLSSRGHEVTIYTSQPLLSTCSSAAACIITPLLPAEWDHRDQNFLTAWGRYRRTIEKFHSIDKTSKNGEKFIETIPSHEFGFEENGELYLEKGFNVSKFNHLPFTEFKTIPFYPPLSVQNHINEFQTCSFYTKFDVDFCNTELFIGYLYDLLNKRGVDFQFKEVKSIDEMGSFGADVIFNCMGFESTKIFPDNSLFYVRGQSMFIEAENQERSYFGIASGNHAIFSHRKGFYIGSYFLEEKALNIIPQKNEYKLSLDFANGAYKEFCKRLGFDIPQINFEKIIRVNTGIRPFRPEGPRVEADEIFVNRNSSSIRVIHNYGHGAHGWTVGFASAEDAVNIAEVYGWLH